MGAGFSRVAIVGCGLIGGSIELAVRERHRDVQLRTLDREDDLARVEGADLVLLAAPILEIVRTLPRLRTHVSPDALITDTGSTKAAIVEAASGMRFIGGHPIAGAAASGREAARADLFAGRTWILTPTAETRHDDVERLRAFVETLGARPHLMDSEEHDRILALVSHLPQMAVSALMHVVGSQAGSDGLALAGAGLRDSTRLAASLAGIWRDIAASNHAHLASGIDALIAALSALRDDDSGEALQRIFESAARWKQALEHRPI